MSQETDRELGITLILTILFFVCFKVYDAWQMGMDITHTLKTAVLFLALIFLPFILNKRKKD